MNNSWIRPSHRAISVTSPNLRFKIITEEDEGTYHCIVTNDDGDVISDNATVYVYGEYLLTSYTCYMKLHNICRSSHYHFNQQLYRVTRGR